MILKKVKKILGFRSENTDTIQKNATNIAKFITKSINKFIIDLKIMSKKSKNLADSNFKLGKKYYRQGHYSEAAFRFSILIKFWPEYFEGYFMLAKSLLAQNKFKKAEKTLNKLVRRKPAFKNRAIELLYESNYQENIK